MIAIITETNIEIKSMNSGFQNCLLSYRRNSRLFIKNNAFVHLNVPRCIVLPYKYHSIEVLFLSAISEKSLMNFILIIIKIMQLF